MEVTFMKPFVLAIALLWLSFSFVYANAPKLTMLQDFETGSVALTSYQTEDIAPNAWSLDQVTTYNTSLYALKLSGNTWKQQAITPLAVNDDMVLQAAIRNTGSTPRIQGIGFSNGIHTLFYSIDGTAVLNIDQWVTVYQGAFNTSTWNLFQFPIAEDWYAYFDEVPTINSIVYINDLDTGTGSTWFDNISVLTTEVPSPPQVSVTYNIISSKYISKNVRSIEVNFFANVIDSDSSIFSYRWEFGDSTFSTEANPTHTYTTADDHPYTVLLKVTDDTGRLGLGGCCIDVDAGESSLPIKMNFVGDIMLARAYESAGGIIQTQGVNAIFEPTKYLLGDAAEITNANLEVVLTNQGSAHPTKSVVYRGNPNNMSGLNYAGIDVVSVANNHILDYGYAGLHQMLDSLTTHNILYSGSGQNSYEAYTPTFINKHGLNIAFLRSCDRTGQYNNAQPYLEAGYNKPGFALFTPYYLAEQMEAVDDVADLKIVEMHGGSEYSLAPGSGYDRSQLFKDEFEDEEYSLYTDVPHMWDIAMRHYAIDNGADLVIVHHPHILHGLEIYHGKLIAHSLGNFVFDLTYPETMPTMILYADADFDGFSNYKVVPCFIDNYIPRPARSKLGIHVLDYLAKRSRDLNTYLLVNKDNVTASVVVDTNTVSFYPTVTYLQESVSPLTDGVYITKPLKLNRSGSITSLDFVNPGTSWQGRIGQECLWMGNMEDEGSDFFAVNLTNETYNSDSAYEGQRSLKIVAETEAATVPIRNKMKWYDNTKSYTLHAWIKSRVATEVNIEIQYFNSRNANNPVSVENLLSEPISGITDWTFYYKDITIPSNCAYYIIVCKVGSGSGWFDEVGLIEWTPWQEVAMLQTIPAPNDYYWLQAKGTENPKSITLQYTEKDLVPGLPQLSRATSPNVISGLSNYPNPFNPEITISFSLKQDSELELAIYNIKGQKVNQLTAGNLTKGKHSFIWNGKDDNKTSVASGIYFYKITSPGYTKTRKIVLIK